MPLSFVPLPHLLRVRDTVRRCCVRGEQLQLRVADCADCADCGVHGGSVEGDRGIASTMTAANPRDAMRQLAERYPGRLTPDPDFLEDLRLLTGHKSIPEMVERFKVLAGISTK